ncbi:transglutaminase family protein [Motiliproteus sediminis]|uniref:transglutaminase family protein n=1 Tax=Motiliproteus sediminis TaxID=1468178 RepID=UPI001AF01892|nr:transglutaminase family protein [Motiliproteus sediminis]
MLFNIQHHTRYDYSQPVRLSPQQLRFHPRGDGSQRVIAHHLCISPTPSGQNEYLDLEGNRVTQVWFEGETQHLEVRLEMQVETLRKNAFDFMLAPQSMSLPINHEQDSICARAYLDRSQADDAVTAFAAELSVAVERDTLRFLDRLSRQLYEQFTQIHRHSGAPQTPAITLQSRSGACRDLAVLFVDCCRAEGIAARFASGYQQGNLQSDRRDLHAWPEVYLPGAGWRGYDPTQGHAVADTHVTIAAAAQARDTLPVIGVFVGDGASSALDFTVRIDVSAP